MDTVGSKRWALGVNTLETECKHSLCNTSLFVFVERETFYAFIWFLSESAALKIFKNQYSYKFLDCKTVGENICYFSKEAEGSCLSKEVDSSKFFSQLFLLTALSSISSVFGNAH